MEYIIAVDVQREFAKTRSSKKVYDKCIKFLKEQGHNYHVIGFFYENKDNPNMHNLVKWDEMQQILPLEFDCDATFEHSGYAPETFPYFTSVDKVHVIGLDTDACVLATCFRLFDSGVDFDIWSDMCQSSGGDSMHRAAISIMKRQFGTAVKESGY